MKSRSDAEGNIKDEDEISLTTISTRFEQNEYSKREDGLYGLYHDLKLVCTLLVHFHPQGTRNYQMVDKFYKFATELLLRECYRLGIMLLEDDMDQYSEEKTAFYNTVSYDFIKISVGYSVPYVENYYISSGDMDLFSSAISKSSLDQRNTELPNNNFTVNKVVTKSEDNIAPPMGFLAANVSNIPDPTLPPTEMMTKFLHPNWYALPTTVWLEYGDYKSWAPCFNESGTVLDAGRRGIIWLEKIGYMTLWRMKSNDEKEKKTGENTESNQTENNIDRGVDDEINGGTDDEANGGKDADKDNQNDVKGEDDFNGKEVVSPKELAPSEPISIKLENLYNWSPGNNIQQDELKAFSEGLQSKLITETLLKIKILKQKRLKLKRVSNPSSEERRLFFKVQRLLREVIIAKQPKSVPQAYARSFPVLQANYTGSIPVARTMQMRKKKYKK